jgi:glycopeptide antibiotics resistance protein
MVFKDLPTITIGGLMLNFSGTNSGHAPKFIPFTTIFPYLLGHKGLIMASINLLGNIGLLIPIGISAPFVFKTYHKASVVKLIPPQVPLLHRL